MGRYTGEQLELSRSYFMGPLEIENLLDSIDRLSLGKIADILRQGFLDGIDIGSITARQFTWLVNYFSPLNSAAANIRDLFPKYRAYTADLANVFLQDSEESVREFGLDLYICAHSLSWSQSPRRLARDLYSLPCSPKLFAKILAWANSDPSNKSALINALDYILSTSTPQP